MLKAFLNSLKITEVRNKLLFTFGLIAVYRIGAKIVIPGVDAQAVAQRSAQGGLLELADMFSGGAFSQFAVFALGIMPYISASIIMQLLTAVIPTLEELKKEGQQGQKKINQYTRYLTVLIATVQGLGMTIRAVHEGVAPDTAMFYFISVLSLVTGAVFVMWLGEQITEYGIGNGISLLIYVSIISSIPALFVNAARRLMGGASADVLSVGALFALLLGLFIVCVWIQTAERRVPIKYARQVRGRKVYGGQASHLPLKVDYSGVIAVIFASSVMLFPVLIFQFAFGNQTSGWLVEIGYWLQRGGFFWAIIYTSLIIFFCYFYTAISFNPNDVAENLKRSGGFIPGRRPGPNTAEYIDKILTRITLVGAIIVACIAIFPVWMSDWFGIQLLFGGTSLLILVGVGLDFVQKLESQLVMRHYGGFMESGRVKGR